MNPKTGIKISAILLVVVGAIMIWAAANRGRAVSQSDDHDVHVEQSSPPEDRLIEPFTLTASNGESFETSALDGKVWVASFFFTACPSVCKKLNERVAILQREFEGQDVRFVSITCDPENDTELALQNYADAFQANPEVWKFLRGDVKETERIAMDVFGVGFAEQTHSDRMLVVDRTGMLRGTYRSTSDEEFHRTEKLIEDLLAVSVAPEETDSPDKDAPSQREQTMAEFQLTSHLDQPFDSKSLEGDYWLGSFFYTSCPSICVMQNMQVAKLQQEYHQRGLKFLSITCDPENDTPAALAGYAERFEAMPEIWTFATGDFDYIQEIGDAFFDIPVEEKYHSDRVFLVGKDGKVIESYRTRVPEQMEAIREKLDSLLLPAETTESHSDESKSSADSETSPEKKDA